MPMLRQAVGNARLPETRSTALRTDLTTGQRLTRGVWRLVDPKISLASIASMLLGICAARSVGPVPWGWAALLVTGILLLEAAKNASGEVFDFDSGADLAIAEEDRSPFSGGKRVIVEGLLSRSETCVVAALFYAGAIALGLVIVLLREPRVLALGLAGVALAFFYHAPPARLSYRGLGEAAVALAYGPLICGGSYLVLRQELPGAVLFLALPLGLLIAAFLWINQFPDRKSDRAAGKFNLVVRLGEERGALGFAWLVTLAGVILLLLPLAGLPRAVWLGLAGLPLALAAARRLLATRETAALIPAQRWTLLAFVLSALGSGLGLLLASP